MAAEIVGTARTLAQQRAWLDKLQTISRRPITVKVLEGNIPEKSPTPDLYRWVYFKDIWPQVTAPIWTRRILENEIVFDPDVKNWQILREEMNKLISFCHATAIPFYLAYTGGNGVHLSIYMKNVELDAKILQEALEKDLDITKIIRQVAVNFLLESSKTDAKKIALDTKKYNFSKMRSGSQLREYGTPRESGGFKTLIDEIPVSKPDAKTLVLKIPDKIELWDISCISEKIDVAIKEEIERAERNNEANLDPVVLTDCKISTFPCAKELIEKGRSSARYYGAQSIALLMKKCGYTWESSESTISKYFKNCTGLTKSEVEKRLLDVKNTVSEYDFHFSCRELKEIFGKEYCNFKKCSLVKKLNIAKSKIGDNNKKQIKDHGFEPSGISNDPIYTDMRNSQKLAIKIQKKAKYNSSSKKWIVYTGKRWEEDKKGLLLRFAREVVRELQQEALAIEDFEARKNAIVNALKCEALPRLKSMVELCQSEEGVCVDAVEFDANKMLLNVQNGTLDLTNGKLLPHNPLDYITKIGPVSYDPTAKCDRFIQFLNEALLWGEEEDKMEDRIKHTQNIIEYLKRFSGYCMTGNTKEEQFLILLGDGGHGKSKWVGAVGYVLGDYYNKIDIATIQESVKGKDGSTPTPDIVKMKGLRLISTSEPDKGLRLNESRIKDFSGRDPITCRDLHASPITYFPEYKLCIYTNYQIIIRGQDKSIWRRIHQVRFDIEPKNIDKDLDLKFQAEGSGILNWMLSGCLDWNKTGLDAPVEILDAVAEYKDDMDILSGFFDLCCICDKNDKNLKELAKDLFYAYQSWWGLENHSNPPYFDKQFYQNLEERGYKRAKKHTKYGMLIYGVTLRKEVKNSIEEAKSRYGAFKGDGVTLVTDFLGIFLPTPYMEKKPGNCITSVTPSPNTSIDSGLDTPTHPHAEVTEITEINTAINNGSQNKPQTTNSLIQLLYKAGNEYKQPINSENINNFCLWVCEHYHPQWQTGTEAGYYLPTGIKGIASKIFGLTPETKGV